MPNWCWTSYVFHGPKDQVDIFKDTLFKAIEKHPIKNDFGNNWLGNVLGVIGIDEDIIISSGSRTEYYCRGSFDVVDEIVHCNCSSCNSHCSDPNDANSELLSDLYVDTRTAWSPMPNVWDRVIEKYGLDRVGYSYSSEEEGMTEFLVHNHDREHPDFVEDFVYLDCSGDISGIHERLIWETSSEEDNGLKITSPKRNKDDELIFKKYKYKPDEYDLKLGEIEESLGCHYMSENEAVDILADLFGVRYDSLNDYYDLINKFNRGKHGNKWRKSSESYINVVKSRIV